jgi:hypothetical protein
LISSNSVTLSALVHSPTFPPSGSVFDLEQLLAVKKHLETVALEIDTEGEPLVGWDRNVDTAATPPTDNVKRTADAADGLVKHHVVLKRIGAGGSGPARIVPDRPGPIQAITLSR